MFIVGIEPKAPGMHIFSQTHMPRLGLPVLLTMAEQMGHTGAIYCEDIAPIHWEDIEKADMILISSLTSTIVRAYSLIKKFREANPRAPILMGGPHVTFLPEEALDNGADYVFRHEADASFVEFLNWWVDGHEGRKLLNIRGMSFRLGDKYHHTPPPARVDLDTLPTPDLDLVYGLGKPDSIPLIGSRGCPFDCDFCSEISMFGRAYRFRSESKIIEDIKYYDRRYGKLDIFFADDNLGANKSRLERLCHEIVKNRLTRPFSGQIRLDLAKSPETLKLLSRAGFERAFIGYESTNPKTLEAAGKKLGSSDMALYTRIIHKYDIEIHAMWVLGFDTDTLETIKENIRASIRWKLETSQFLILVPIPGSALYERFKRDGRIFNKDWSKYDGHHVTFYPVKMTPRQLQIAVMLEAMPKLYNYSQTLKIFTVDSWRTVKASFKLKNWHPIRRVKGTILTLVVRIWGRRVSVKMRKPIKNYIQEIPVLTSESPRLIQRTNLTES
jgi:radical SAM superfamily enzyme YgiQ (UPF0313 family)